MLKMDAEGKHLKHGGECDAKPGRDWSIRTLNQGSQGIPTATRSWKEPLEHMAFQQLHSGLSYSATVKHVYCLSTATSERGLFVIAALAN